MDRLQYVAAIEDVIAERQRQALEKGYTPEHDDGHKSGELVMAAIAYIDTDEQLWPWGEESFKPRNRRHDLARAAALLIAEIERLDRVGRTALGGIESTASDDAGSWAKELGPLQQGDIELLEDAIEALLQPNNSLMRDHAVHGLQKRVQAAKGIGNG
jgi:hypothetical protein